MGVERMKNLRARFTGHTSVLTITARQGKNGLNVVATIRKPGEKIQTGSKSLHKNDAEAIKAYDKLKADALAAGWVEKSKAKAGGRGVGFTSIPGPTASDPNKVAEQNAKREAKVKERATKAKAKVKK